MPKKNSKVMNTQCPKCGAEKGTPCHVTPEGLPAHHAERFSAAGYIAVDLK